MEHYIDSTYAKINIMDGTNGMNNTIASILVKVCTSRDLILLGA